MKRNTTSLGDHPLQALELDIPVPAAHMSQLRSQLMHQARVAHSSEQPPRSNYFKEFFMKRISILGGGLAAFALIIGALSFSFSQSPSAAAASVNRAQKAVSELSEKELTALKSRLPEDPKVLLQKARNAADLHEVTCVTDPTEQQLPEGISPSEIITQSAGSVSNSDVRGPNKCLAYTDNGMNVVIGLDADNLPVTVTMTK